MSTINDTDQFLVQRGSKSYKQSAKDLMSTIQDTDYMLIQRGAESFKVTCEDVKDQLGSGVGSVVISKGVISPSSNLEAGDTLTGTATVTGNVAPTVYIHKWFVNGAQDTSATTNTFRAKEGQVTYQLCLTDPNNTTAVCGEVSDAVTVGPATKPNATMYGLRFYDGRDVNDDRDSYLRGPTSKTISTYTISFWVKRTQEFTDGVIFASMGNANAGTNGLLRIKIDTSNNLRILSRNQGGTEPSSTPLTINIWTHVVVSVNGSDCTVYIDGDQKGTASDWGDATFTEPTIGQGLNNLGASEELDGYLSGCFTSSKMH